MDDWSWPAELLPDGVTLRMIDVNGRPFELAECGAGDRLALCLHGFPELPISWRNQMPLLAELGWRVWAPAQRGYGRSFRPSGVHNYSVDLLVQDVAGFIDTSGAREVMLLAHDWGGAVAWAFAAQRVRPLSRLVMMNMPHPLLMGRELKRNPRQMLMSWYIGLFQLPGLPERRLTANGGKAMWDVFRTGPGRPPLPDTVVQAYADNICRPGAATAMLNWYRAAFRERAKQSDRFPHRIEAPTLLVWGDADMALHINASKGTEELVPNLTFRRLPGISHWVQQDAASQVNDILREWLAHPV